MIETWSKMVEVDGVKTGPILAIFKGRAKRVYLWTGVGYEKKKKRIKDDSGFEIWALEERSSAENIYMAGAREVSLLLEEILTS